MNHINLYLFQVTTPYFDLHSTNATFKLNSYWRHMYTNRYPKAMQGKFCIQYVGSETFLLYKHDDMYSDNTFNNLALLQSGMMSLCASIWFDTNCDLDKTIIESLFSSLRHINQVYLNIYGNESNIKDSTHLLNQLRYLNAFITVNIGYYKSTFIYVWPLEMKEQSMIRNIKKLIVGYTSSNEIESIVPFIDFSTIVEIDISIKQDYFYKIKHFLLQPKHSLTSLSIKSTIGVNTSSGVVTTNTKLLTDWIQELQLLTRLHIEYDTICSAEEILELCIALPKSVTHLSLLIRMMSICYDKRLPILNSIQYLTIYNYSEFVYNQSFFGHTFPCVEHLCLDMNMCMDNYYDYVDMSIILRTFKHLKTIHLKNQFPLFNYPVSIQEIKEFQSVSVQENKEFQSVSVEENKEFQSIMDGGYLDEVD